MRIVGGIVVTDPLEGESQADATLTIEAGLITEVGGAARSSDPTEETLDARGCWVLPGLVDAHTHLYSALALGMPLRGEPPRSFPEVLHRIWWRLDKALTPEDVLASAYVGAINSLKQGVTTVMDHHSSPGCTYGSLDLLAEAAGAVGIRASLCYEVSDRDGAESREQGIRENLRFLRRCRGEHDPKRAAHFGLHAVYTLSDETLARCAEAGRACGAGFHLHVLEHQGERDKFEAEHGGRSVVELLQALGILGQRTIVAHAVWASHRDAELLAASGCYCAYNPRSNMGNGVGVAPVVDLLSAGATVCLGTDGYYDLRQEMATAPLLQNLGRADAGAMGPRQVLQMVFGSNCRLACGCFGLPFGKLAPGFAGDVVLVEYDPSTPVTEQSLAAHVLSCLSLGRVRAVVVAGRVLVRDGRLLSCDEGEIRAAARKQAASLWARL